jgi:hypothetical protein
MTPPEQSYTEVLGGWIVDAADDVLDMGKRVVEVLGRNPRDHHYAGEKMHHALRRAAEVMTYAGWTEEELLALVREAYERALRNTGDLRREFEECRS